MKFRSFLSSSNSSKGMLPGSPILGFSSLLSAFKDSSGIRIISSAYSLISVWGSNLAASSSSKYLIYQKIKQNKNESIVFHSFS